jgi:Methyltransferase FkbM domain
MGDPHNDLWALQIFGPNHIGYFVEVGAADGVRGSSCHILEQRGWQGICVEPSQHFYTELSKDRAVCENVCLWEYDGVVTYFDTPWLGGVLGAVREKHVRNIQPKSYPALTFKTLLSKHNSPPIIDFIAIDAEGSERNMLKVFPFNDYHVTAWAIEGNLANDILLTHGYTLVKNPFNDGCPWEHYFLKPKLL